MNEFQFGWKGFSWNVYKADLATIVQDYKTCTPSNRISRGSVSISQKKTPSPRPLWQTDIKGTIASPWFSTRPRKRVWSSMWRAVRILRSSPERVFYWSTTGGRMIPVDGKCLNNQGSVEVPFKDRVVSHSNISLFMTYQWGFIKLLY